MLDFIGLDSLAGFTEWLVLLAFISLPWLLGMRYIPHDRVGIVEKLVSLKGSLGQGRIVALRGEAGYQADLLRGGLHFGLFPLQYRLHREPLVMIAEGQLGYVYARGGRSLAPHQSLGRTVECNHFQDARAFVTQGGERGRQRQLLREGVYAVNLALFVVITEGQVYTGPISKPEREQYLRWQSELRQQAGFRPVIVGQVAAKGKNGDGGNGRPASRDTAGIVTVHDGPPLSSNEIIAPEVKPKAGERGHSYFQNSEAFLALGGRRGKQLQVLTDGTFFINRWFATVELTSKVLIPIGHVGVVVSYQGVAGEDVTGDLFRYGEQVEPGHRGVWKRALPPGKYALNPYALTVELVPTVNFVLRWVTGTVESHEYDKDLTSVELITADGYEPELPLSLILHIDYEKAPRVVQRFGNVRRLISQTLDPILAAYFRDVAQHVNMLDLLMHRDEIQRRATEELGQRFQQYDINCVAVLIGRPQSRGNQYQPGQDPIERLFDQLRMRRLAKEQIDTFAKQEEAAVKLKELNSAQAAAQKQTELTQTKVDIEIVANRGQAELEQARRLAQRDVVRAQGTAQAKELVGKGQAAAIRETGQAEAAVFEQKIRAYRDPKLFALQCVSEQMARSHQPIVPERMMMMGATGDASNGQILTPLGQLVSLLASDRAGLFATEREDSEKGPETNTSGTT